MWAHLIHCSYHKCLTVFFGRIMTGVFNRCLPWSRGYHHFNSHLEHFYSGFGAYRLASINNRALDLGRIGRFRVSRFIRDPRDLIVSGYFYHRRGVEPWTTTASPAEADWYFANGCVPKAVQRAGCSFAHYLQSVPEEEGLLAELEFRRRHLESMAQWPSDHPDIVTYRYEEIIGNEVEVIRELADFYGFSGLERRLSLRFAARYAVAARSADSHVRNPTSGQWRKHFSPRIRKAFNARYGDLVKRLGYSTD